MPWWRAFWSTITGLASGVQYFDRYTKEERRLYGRGSSWRLRASIRRAFC